MAFQSAFLCERAPTDGTHEPLIIVVYTHVLSQRFLPLIRLVAYMARVYSFSVVFYHVHFQGIPRVKGEVALVALMVPLVQMVASDVTRQMSGRYIALGTRLALIPLQLFIVDLCQVFLSSVERR